MGDLDADTKSVTIKRANINRRIVETKTDAGERVVPVFASVRRAILEHKLRSVHSGDEDYVFCDVFGRPLDPAGTVKGELAATFRAAKLPERAFRFHDLRHFAVSRLIDAGANILLISRIAGHAKPDVTLRVYSHLMHDGVIAAADTYDPLEAAS